MVSTLNSEVHLLFTLNSYTSPGMRSETTNCGSSDSSTSTATGSRLRSCSLYSIIKSMQTETTYEVINIHCTIFIAFIATYILQIAREQCI